MSESIYIFGVAFALAIAAVCEIAYQAKRGWLRMMRGVKR